MDHGPFEILEPGCEAAMISIITLIIFTVAFVAAAEYAWWGPERRIRTDVEQRLRGLRVEGGRRSMSLLRQQQMGGNMFLARFQLMKNLQAMIDQARLPYRAGNVVTFSGLLLVASYF